MSNLFNEQILKSGFKISAEIIKLCDLAQEEAAAVFKDIDSAAAVNSLRVIHAMQERRLSTAHLERATGYGYNDAGRDCLEEIYADIMGCEDALVRPQIISGTHALNIALTAFLKPGDVLLSVTGAPYDTLLSVIGVNETENSLIKNGVIYKQAELTPNGDIDYTAVKRLITKKTKIALIQRSRGYSLRRAFSLDEICKVIKIIKQKNPAVICAVDNCYGEFTSVSEPGAYGADLVIGSLIKNPGGGLAETGGYIAGKYKFVSAAADRLTAPGLGKEIGPGLGLVPSMLKGLFIAPEVTAGALKGAVLCAYVFEALGYTALPKWNAPRNDIVQAVQFKSAEKLKRFCEAVQSAAPVDSFVKPVPAPMPGYAHDVIMAAGAFTQGSSVELSADGPLREPYTAFFQGGLYYNHAKLGVMLAAERVKNTDSIFAP